MCGIAGFFDARLPDVERQPLLERMCDTIVHRGPDDRGFHADGTVGLGMQRLSIVDLAGGHQPFSTEDGALHVVFNGEIYNHAELRASLAAQGAQFRTVCDTEVVLRAFEHHGLEGLSGLNGMFAIALWDRRSRKLHLIRDRLGVKPLYYYWDGSRLLFGSEIKAILAGLHQRPAVNGRAVWDYLTFRYVPAPHTIWENIFKLPPGHRLTIASDRPEPEVRRYWDIPYDPEPTERPFAELDEEFEALFQSAVDLRMVADVPVGITLSGGLDSSTVAAAAARGGHSGVATFSVAFADSPATNEIAFAREVSAHVGTDHHVVEVGEREFLEFLPDMVHLTDEPLADLASVPLFFVSRLARESVKVALSGEGADEVLGGYNFDVLAAQWELDRSATSVPMLGRGAVARAVGRYLPRLGRPGGAPDLRDAPVPLNMTNYMACEEKTRLLGGSRWPDSMQGLRDALARLGPREPLHQALYLYCQDWLVEDLLMKADRMSMGNSLELRTPFLDYRLVEWAARTPTWTKVGRDAHGHFQTKHVLRRLARRLLPGRIVDRPKQGFPVPVYDWLSGALRGWTRDMLLSGSTRLRDWFEDEPLRQQVEEGTRDDAPVLARHRVWNLLVLEIWMRRWTTA